MDKVKFEKITKYEDVDFNLPVRKTALSAGYDFEVIENIIIPSHYMQIGKMLYKHLSSDKFLDGFGELEIIKSLIEAGQKFEQLSEPEKINFLGQLSVQFPELVTYVKSQFVLDLEDVKNLTKATDTRMTLVPTGVKAKLEEDQKLELLIRSSTPLGAYLMMANGVGLIDADYYNNVDNEGHIYFQILNLSPFNIRLKKGDIIGQGVISSYEETTKDFATGERVGGLGSNN